MKFSEQWLREWVDPSVSTGQLVEQLTMAGLEVDAVEPVAPPFDGIVVGEVLAVDPHPDADKLRICRVAVGTAGEPLQIVCGAANVRIGMRVPAALVGATLPGGLAIKKAKLRGVESGGMLCSAKELGIAEDAEGLLELPLSASAGQDVRALLHLDDHSIEVDLTPNRGDCLSVAGIAREIGVLNRCEVRMPATNAVAHTIADTIPVDVVVSRACPRYLGRVIRGIDNHAVTPLWMKERLRRSGLRSLGPLVDVTNYVLLELGQPMHAFDIAKLDGGITVRWAVGGESITLLDGKQIVLDEKTLVIADHSRALALAGVMGGQDSAVSDATRSVFLECAFFAPEAIAGRARRYGLQTDSAHRFERGVDPCMQRRAMERATALLLEIAGGQAGPIVERVADSDLPARQTIVLRRMRIRRVLGMELPDPEIEEIISRLGMHVQSHPEGWRVTPPGYRFDISLEADLIEELARIHGYNRLQSSRPMARLALSAQPENTVDIERIHRLLVDRGYQEVITYSFVDPALQKRLDPGAEPIALANPISAELSVMRTQLWGGLLKTLIHNQNRQQGGGRFYETGLNYVRQGNDIRQDKYIACLINGSSLPEQWGVSQQSADFYDIKADLEAILGVTADLAACRMIADQHPALHPGQSARIVSGEVSLGWIGALHPDIERELELSGRTLLLELNLSALQCRYLPHFHEISKYPAIRRDLAVVADEVVSADAVLDCVRTAAGELLRNLLVFDVYRGAGVESGRRSIALGLILQDSSRTLKDDDVDAVINRVMVALNQELNATLRD